jgi:multisubunit Na+/H+ antiporter MnhG subunit
LVYEANRLGEALMVLASILVFWAYGRGVSFRTRNRQQRRRALWFGAVSGVVFLALLFMDYFLGLYNPVLAHSIRKAGEGISWIFQMGMGYTFYLPFACYVAGLLCWSYTVIRLVTMGRLAGYGLALMFIAGYALLFSSLSLMVILGVMLLTLDRPKGAVMEQAAVTKPPLVDSQNSLVSGHI